MQPIKKIQEDLLKDILFMDIETVPLYPDYQSLDERWKALWDHKAAYFLKSGEAESSADIYNKAGLFAEFGKVICVSMGVYDLKNKHFKIKAIAGHDEKKLLEELHQLLDKLPQRFKLCGHNGKEFDFPFIARRMLANGILLPDILDHRGKKPWEVPHIDTMELWKMGDYKHYTSLDLLTCLFSIPTPKDDISGKDVAEVYWKNDDLDRIIKYCNKDVQALVQVYLSMHALDVLAEEQIIFQDIE